MYRLKAEISENSCSVKVELVPVPSVFANALVPACMNAYTMCTHVYKK